MAFIRYFNPAIISIALIAILSLAISIRSNIKSTKVAYVRSQEIVYGYLGMKEANNKFEEESRIWQANIDTLEIDLRRAVINYQNSFNDLSIDEKNQKENLLKKQETDLRNYVKAIKNKSKLEDEKITIGVLNQINSYIENYGKQNGYDVIMGSTAAGNILFGKDAIDITDEILKGLNESYLGTNKFN